MSEKEENKSFRGAAAVRNSEAAASRTNRCEAIQAVIGKVTKSLMAVSICFLLTILFVSFGCYFFGDIAKVYNARADVPAAFRIFVPVCLAAAQLTVILMRWSGLLPVILRWIASAVRKLCDRPAVE